MILYVNSIWIQFKFIGMTWKDGIQKKNMYHVLQLSEPMRPMVYCKVFDPPMCLDVFKCKYRTPAFRFASFDIINGKNLNAKSTISRTLSIYLEIF